MPTFCLGAELRMPTGSPEGPARLHPRVGKGLCRQLVCRHCWAAPWEMGPSLLFPLLLGVRPGKRPRVPHQGQKTLHAALGGVRGGMISVAWIVVGTVSVQAAMAQLEARETAKEDVPRKAADLAWHTSGRPWHSACVPPGMSCCCSKRATVGSLYRGWLLMSPLRGCPLGGLGRSRGCVVLPVGPAEGPPLPCTPATSWSR